MLALVRHGRTFAPGTPAVWIGAHEDPPLTAAGMAEAQALGEALRGAVAGLCWVGASPMARTQAHARTVLTAAGGNLPVQPIGILRELHYGSWAGRSRDDIVAEGGAAALGAWEAAGHYPDAVGFAPGRDVVLQALWRWLQEMQKVLHASSGGWALAVTHGGILRLIASLLQPGSAGGKVACGHGCLIRLDRDGPQALAWNEPPNSAVWQTLCARPAGSTLADDA